jgi:hypothetical protein
MPVASTRQMMRRADVIDVLSVVADTGFFHKEGWGLSKSSENYVKPAMNAVLNGAMKSATLYSILLHKNVHALSLKHSFTISPIPLPPTLKSLTLDWYDFEGVITCMMPQTLVDLTCSRDQLLAILPLLKPEHKFNSLRLFCCGTKHTLPCEQIHTRELCLEFDAPTVLPSSVEVLTLSGIRVVNCILPASLRELTLRAGESGLSDMHPEDWCESREWNCNDGVLELHSDLPEGLQRLTIEEWGFNSSLGALPSTLKHLEIGLVQHNAEHGLEGTLCN